MISGDAIHNLVGLLTRRGVSLFHACQFVDFCTYLRLGGIPSRSLLEQSRLGFTVFETDIHDRHNGVWDKVFVNLADFGETFAHGYNGVPNPYGPILLQLKPSALTDVDDVAICLRSAGAKDFDREKEAISSVEIVNELFLYASEIGFPWSAQFKPTPQLQRFRANARWPEVSCTVKQECISLRHVIVIWTDPYTICGKTLNTWVSEVLAKAGFSFNLHDRCCHGDRREMYSELLQLVSEGSTSLNAVAHNPLAAPPLQSWAEVVQAQNLDYQFRRYSQYLLNGTIRPLVDGSEVDTFPNLVVRRKDT